MFHFPFLWPHETAVFIFGAYIVAAGAYVLLHGGHVNVDIFQRRFSLRTRAIVDLGTAIFFFLFCGLLVWQSAKMGLTSVRLLEKTQSAWAPPIYPVKMFLPIAAFLLLMQGLAIFIRNLRIAITGKQQEGTGQ